jgi:hypothetical protein
MLLLDKCGEELLVRQCIQSEADSNWGGLVLCFMLCDGNLWLSEEASGSIERVERHRDAVCGHWSK